jgi:hypothetical protein
MDELLKTHTIELDCPPGFPRPGDLIGGVLEGTGLTLEDHFEEDVPKSFGNWTYVLKKEYISLYEEARPKIKERVHDLYNRGRIRYGSW